MRRRGSTLLGLCLLIPAIAFAAKSPQMPIAGSGIPQFVQELPQLSLTPNLTTSPFLKATTGSRPITLRMCQFQANVLPAGVRGLAQSYAGTWVWGYLEDPTGTNTCDSLIAANKNSTGLVETYLGPVIANRRGVPTKMTFINDLPKDATTTNVDAYKYSTDLTLHWADPLGDTMKNGCMGQIPLPGSECAKNYIGPVAAVPHLHGGEVPPELDGGPDAWYTSDGLHHGSRYYASTAFTVPTNATVYNYPNDQDAAPIWFHDHTLGATRLNVFAGLAGGYYIYDDPDTQTLAPGLGGLNALLGVIPLVLQDRMFDINGQLFFPADSAGGILWTTNPDHPYWVPEFIGDTMVVNGKAWPFVNVEPKRYRILFLNGSNARTYELFLTNPKTKINGPSIYIIGTDGGYLDAPALLDPNALKPAVQHLVIMPGERYEAIIDFTNFAGQTLVMKNVGKSPYPGGATPTGGMDKVVQFRVAATASGPGVAYDPSTGAPIRSSKIQRLVNPTTGTIGAGVPVKKTRALTLNEVLKAPSNTADPVTGLPTAYPGGPLEILVNNTKWSGESTRTYNDFTVVNVGSDTIGFSEMPVEGETEVWEIVNTTADAHPIHLHLVQFQILNRQNYNVSNYMKAYAAAFPADPIGGYVAGIYHPSFGPPLEYNRLDLTTGFKYGGNPDVGPYLQGAAMPPQAHEAGWKDTAVMLPGQVTRLAVRWAPTSAAPTADPTTLHFAFDPSGGDGQFNYVWHCHIIDHEDNEMMRPDFVKANQAESDRLLKKGVAY